MKDRPACKCHGVPMTSQGEGWRCTAKHRARERRYYAENLQRERARNHERLYIGGTYYGRVRDAVKREAILAHASNRLYEFKSKQAAEQANFEIQLAAEAHETDNASLLAAFQSSFVKPAGNP